MSSPPPAGPSVVSANPSAATSAATHGGRYPSLVDRTVLITGGATGIGESLVTHFARQGARVGFIDIADAAAADLLGGLGDVRHTPVFAHCDLTDIDALRRTIDGIRASQGPISVLVNNAANDVRHAVDTVTSASWDAGIAVN
ncbi:MAG: SDR family NAD(P)-dependent oxidoreductase, partial [Janthinobacterium lividum]